MQTQMSFYVDKSEENKLTSSKAKSCGTVDDDAFAA
jgi:uncharacterized OB-fold protein